MILDKCLLEKNITELAESDINKQKAFGSAYLVLDKSGVVSELCFGNTSVENGRSVDARTLFRLASMTKPVTAVAVLILVERGRISLSDPIHKYIPEFADMHVVARAENGEYVDLGAPKKAPTVKNLLTHTSGFGSDYAKLASITAEDRRTVDSFVDYVMKFGLDYEPDTEERYSGTAAYDVLVKLVEAITGRDYYDFIKEELLLPLEMCDTVFAPSEEQWDRLIAMHTVRDGKNAVAEMPKGCIFGEFPCEHRLGGAGLVSTLNDYGHFASMLLNGGVYNGRRIIAEETVRLMAEPYIPKGPDSLNQSWGLSVRVVTTAEYADLPIGSFGWSGAYGTHFWIDPVNGVAAVMLRNSQLDGGGESVSAREFEKAVNASFVR